MRILIVEDEPLMAQSHEIMVEVLGHEVVEVVDRAEAALEACKRETPELILMDIQIQGQMDGVELASLLYQQYAIPVIFITSLKDDQTFQRAAALMPLAYIVKPFDNVQLKLTIELAIRQVKVRQLHAAPEPLVSSKIGDSFFVRARGKLVKLQFSDIRYMKADGRYTHIFVKEDHKYTVRQTLGELETKVPDKTFFRSHRSYLVNLDYLQSIETFEMVVWIDGNPIPLSKEKKSVLSKLLEQI